MDKLKLLFVVDGRSPIALNWIRYFVDHEHEVHIASMYPCEPDLELASLTVIPVTFSGAVKGSRQNGNNGGMRRSIIQRIATPNLRTWLRQRFIPRSLPKAAAILQSLILDLEPDIIHAMRVPYEGMLAALTLDKTQASGMRHPPLIVSIWGNDFTLHASATRQMTKLTRFTMERTDALHTDCYRDQPLAQEWGFDPSKPSVVLPGGGGIQRDIFKPPESGKPADISSPIVVNPRGLRAYVRNDIFFKAVPLVLQEMPGVRFLCPTMAGAPEAERWVRTLQVSDAVELLPRLPRVNMAALFRQAQVVVSPSTHDGTPNTLLEALACGCFPVVGDIEPLREWITQGENGFLVDPTDPQELAISILAGLQNPHLRTQAQKINSQLIDERADYHLSMQKAATFYRSVIQTS